MDIEIIKAQGVRRGLRQSLFERVDRLDTLFSSITEEIPKSKYEIEQNDKRKAEMLQCMEEAKQLLAHL